MEEIIEIVDSMSSTMCQGINEGMELIGGNNGPYHDQETALRVSAHWICTFRYEFQKTGDSRYIDAIRRLADTICEHQEHNKTFVCRNKEGKDKTNGVIGTAWIVEGLAAAALACNDESYYRAGVQTFFAQPFDHAIGLWKRRDADGMILSHDGTYNHQLWLAAAGAQLCGFKLNEDIQSYILNFLNHSVNTFQSYPNGLAHHFVYFSKPLARALKSRVNYGRQRYLQILNRPCYRYKEEGYHNFTMYAFAILHHYYPDHSFFNCQKFKRSLLYSLDFAHSFALANNNKDADGTGMAKQFNCDCNIFGFSYNSPAFEMPFILKEFSSEDHTRELNLLADMQIKLTYDFQKQSFCKNTEDAVTLNARVYEFIRGLV